MLTEKQRFIVEPYIAPDENDTEPTTEREAEKIAEMALHLLSFLEMEIFLEERAKNGTRLVQDYKAYNMTSDDEFYSHLHYIFDIKEELRARFRRILK